MEDEEVIDDEGFVDWWIEQQPLLSKEEENELMERINKFADYVIDNKLTPNIDYPN